MTETSDSVAKIRRPFVSYAYEDEGVKAAFNRSIPSDIAPQFFEPITVLPDELVSEKVINAVLDCDSLIYFSGGSSERSFWVAFERDLAARAGKPIFRFEPISGKLTRVEVHPLDLPVFPAFRNRDFMTVSKLLDIMRDRRNIELYLPENIASDKVKWTSELYKTLNQGGFVVVFWSKGVAESKRLEQVIQRTHDFLPSPDATEQKLLFALLDSTPLPDWYAPSLSKCFSPIHPVQLYADDELSLFNHLDDLIVRIYWLVWRSKYVIMGPA